MGAEHKKSKDSNDERDMPFKGVPSEQVGRGPGQDPSDQPDEDKPECEALQKMKREFKEQTTRERSS